MTNESILDIFYTQIIPEAQKGKIDCYFKINMPFNVIIENKEITKSPELPYNGLIIPTLRITDKISFDGKLIEYVKKAKDFYRASDYEFLNDLDFVSDKDSNQQKEEYLIKYLIVMLFANATLSDFEYPLSFLDSRISMMDNNILDREEEIELGNIDSISAKMFIKEEVSPIKAETPYRIKSRLQFDDGYDLILPEIYVGKTNNKYQLYGIQKTTKNSDINERPYLKQIRKGFISKINGAPEHYFLAVMLFLSLCNDKEIEITPFLVERWNAKRIAMENKVSKDPTYTMEDLERDQDKIQSNITDIFIRYFTKLEDVCIGLDFCSIPLEVDTDLHINIRDNFESRSVAFNELFQLVQEYKNTNNLTK